MKNLTKVCLVLTLSCLIIAPTFAANKLRLIGDHNIMTGTKFNDTEIGGLGGIVYDPKTNKLLSISDDKSLVNPARFYEFDLALTEKSFTVTPSKVTFLYNEKGELYKKGFLDAEGITYLDGDIFIVTEGAINRTYPLPPSFYRYSREGKYKDSLPIPEKFLLPKKGSENKEYGSRHNQSFETLSASPDGQTVYIATEESLLQDGPPSNTQAGSHVRIIQYKKLIPTKEFAYKLEKVEEVLPDPNFPDKEIPIAENGLVDMAIIDENNFYTMERSYLPSIRKNVIRIFKCRVTEKTTDVSSFDSLKGQTFTAVEKTLVSDLDEFLPGMNPPSLDNLEGIAFGPDLPNGNKTLILVADNNFGRGQRTLFMALEILPETTESKKAK